MTKFGGDVSAYNGLSLFGTVRGFRSDMQGHRLSAEAAVSGQGEVELLDTAVAAAARVEAVAGVEGEAVVHPVVARHAGA